MKKKILFITTLFISSIFAACSSSDRIYIGNSPKEAQLVKEGRDTQTIINTKMPALDTPKETYKGTMPQTQVQDSCENISVDDKIDFSKI